MIYHFILNPKSGMNKKERGMESVIKSACKTRQLDYRIYYTTCAGDATNYVREMVSTSSERQRFICVGGDGTINEIVNSAPCNPDVEFGVIPKGSGNDFVRNFTNRKLFADINAQIDGGTVSLDLIKCNDFYCANMVNIGFDCMVVKEADKLKKIKFLPPSLLYIAGVLVALFKKFGTKMKLIFDDGTTFEKELTLNAIGNGKYCGGGFKSAPIALLDDGLMDVCSINKVSRLTFLSLVSAYKKGTYLDNKKAQKLIKYQQVPHFKMEFDNPLPICIDGEIKGAKNIEFTCIKNAFNFVVPKGCALKHSATGQTTGDPK